MPELHFKGKEYVYNHHLTVPYRPLMAHPDKSIGGESENLIIHGDNLHALKALLPRYACKVDCIFIDPPYSIQKSVPQKLFRQLVISDKRIRRMGRVIA